MFAPATQSFEGLRLKDRCSFSDGLAEASTIFEYTSPASGTSEAIVVLKTESGTTYTEADAHIKY